MYTNTFAGWGETPTASQSRNASASISTPLLACDLLRLKILKVPVRASFDEFFKVVCCAIGRWTIFRKDKGRRAWCFAKRNEGNLRLIYDRARATNMRCVKLYAIYCYRPRVQPHRVIDVRIVAVQFLPATCRASSLCRYPGVCQGTRTCQTETCRPCLPQQPDCHHNCSRQYQTCQGGNVEVINPDCFMRYRQCVQNCGPEQLQV